MNTHLALVVPDEWTNTQKGEFFEEFIGELLRPMQYRITQNLRVTGMEIDLLAKSIDDPRQILVECKAHRDPLASEVISKLFGNVQLRGVSSGWLFSTSDLSKDAKGQWESIQASPSLSAQFSWFSPERIIEILIAQRAVVDPRTLTGRITKTVGDWLLLITPSRHAWLAQIVEDGVPTRFTVFDAKSGAPLPREPAEQVAGLSPRFSALTHFEINEPAALQQPRIPRAPVAKVIPGDKWDDLRPARPMDFVGRDDVLKRITAYIADVRSGESRTRTFAILAPSGWGKSSFVLKLENIALKGKLGPCSVTVVDSRSATNASFTVEALRTAFTDAVDQGVIAPMFGAQIDSLRYPLDSPQVQAAFEYMKGSNSYIVLIFDQFEELFSKEELFETFAAVRELCLDVDAREAPVLLGFSWKTDVSLPQQHPAYHLWHQLDDRRRSFRLREFGPGDMQKIINRAQRDSGKTLSDAVRARLIEQCQGYPWLLKKLLVHVLQRVSTPESQYQLLERELDVESLFKEDLSLLTPSQIRCLKFVAERAPVAVSEVEDTFDRETTNSLLHQHLLVRSGLNYVIYWDIFRDYLVDERVPQIPWTRTFQRDPKSSLQLLQTLSDLGASTADEIARAVNISDGTCFNILSDLIALQLVDRAPGDRYSKAVHLSALDPLAIARHVQGQLERHVIVRELASNWERGRRFSIEAWHAVFTDAHPRSDAFSEKTILQYAANFRRWLLFAGILEQAGPWLVRPVAPGRQMGVLSVTQRSQGLFLGTSSPKSFKKLLQLLFESPEGKTRDALEIPGLRNAITDALALGLLVQVGNGMIKLREAFATYTELTSAARQAILAQDVMGLIELAGRNGMSDAVLGAQLKGYFGAGHWKPISAQRYAAGLRRMYEWAAVDQ
jgi:hypothetical protein